MIKSHASQSGKEESQHWEVRLGLQPAREAMFLRPHLADDTVVIFEVILCAGTDRFDMPRLVDIMSRSSMWIRNGSSLGIVHWVFFLRSNLKNPGVHRGKHNKRKGQRKVFAAWLSVVRPFLKVVQLNPFVKWKLMYECMRKCRCAWMQMRASEDVALLIYWRDQWAKHMCTPWQSTLFCSKPCWGNV